MDRGIILLTDISVATELVNPLHAAAPGLAVTVVQTLSELEVALAEPEGKRLIAFCTGVIVPKRLLDRLDGPGYNLHPGPPEYPGIFPSVFAIEDEAVTFGVTLHELREKVDTGPIVAVARFDLPEDIHRVELDAMAREVAVRFFAQLAPALVRVGEPLGPLGPEEAAWGAKVYRSKDFEALLQLPPDIDQATFERRYRAVGEGPDHALTVHLHGHAFMLKGMEGATILRGGHVVDTNQGSSGPD